MIALSVVVPAFNEEEVIRKSADRLVQVLETMALSYELIFVDDGSRDATLEILRSLARDNSNIRVLSFSRNFGHQPAISAGMEAASGEAVVVIDADLQDPPELIPALYDKYLDGYDVVYARRTSRKGESAFKKVTAAAFYRFLGSITEVDIPSDVGDYRLISRRVCDLLCSLPEHNRYVRGLVSFVGFKQTAVDFERQARAAGVTKYPLKKMLKFAADGMTSFSYFPIRLPMALGIATCALSFILFVLMLVLGAGWLSISALAIFFAGLVLFFMGVMGQYIGRLTDEARGRPNYIVALREGFPDDGTDKKI